VAGATKAALCDGAGALRREPLTRHDVGAAQVVVEVLAHAAQCGGVPRPRLADERQLLEQQLRRRHLSVDGKVDLLLLRVQVGVGVAREDGEERAGDRREVLDELARVVVPRQHGQRAHIERRADVEREVVKVEEARDRREQTGDADAQQRGDRLPRPRLEEPRVPALPRL